MTFTQNPCPCILYKYSTVPATRSLRMPPYAKNGGFTMNFYYINSSKKIDIFNTATVNVSENASSTLEVLDTKPWSTNGFPLLSGKTLLDEEAVLTLNITTRSELKFGSVLAITVEET